jgi:hypothetical protein
MNYHMNKLDNTLLELFNMLKIVEDALKKEKKCLVFAIRRGLKAMYQYKIKLEREIYMAS